MRKWKAYLERNDSFVCEHEAPRDMREDERKAHKKKDKHYQGSSSIKKTISNEFFSCWWEDNGQKKKDKEYDKNPINYVKKYIRSFNIDNGFICFYEILEVFIDHEVIWGGFI